MPRKFRRNYQVFFENSETMYRFCKLYSEVIDKEVLHICCRNYKTGSEFKHVITFRVYPKEFSAMKRDLSLKRRFVGRVNDGINPVENFSGWCFIN